jgi:NADP-dependent 3-hydroxy acid dehydrogenase YdfG
MSQTLAGQVALITGASRGIGQAISRSLAAEGAHLVLAARSTDALTELADELKALFPTIRVLTVPTDVSRLEDLQKLAAVARETFGRVDVLINNAGIASKIGLLSEVPEAEILQTVAVNLSAPLLLMRLLLPDMVGQGRGTIININSVAGKTAFPFWALYDATKFGLRAATEAVAEEQRPNGVRVVGIYPGACDTAIWDTIDTAHTGPDRDGMLRPEQVADAVLYVLRQPQEVFVSDITLMPTRPAL